MDGLTWKVIKTPNTSTDHPKIVEKNRQGVDVELSKSTTYVDSFFSHFDENLKKAQNPPMRKKRLRSLPSSKDGDNDLSVNSDIFLEESDIPVEIKLNPKQLKQYKTMLKRQKEIDQSNFSDPSPNDQLFDIWGNSDSQSTTKPRETNDPAIIYDETRVLMKTKNIKKPKKPASTFNPRPDVPNVPVPHPGASLNPAPEEHSALYKQKKAQLEKIYSERAKIAAKLAEQPEYANKSEEDVDLTTIETNPSPYPVEARHRTYKTKPINQKHAVRRRTKQLHREIQTLDTIANEIVSQASQIHKKNATLKQQNRQLRKERAISTGSRPLNKIVEVAESSEPIALRDLPAQLPGDPFAERYKSLVKNEKIVHNLKKRRKSNKNRGKRG